MAHRTFKTEAAENWFLIKETGITERHPLNWTDGSYTRESAWKAATSQDKRIFIRLLCGEQREIGTRFDPRSFEEAMYLGYVGHGLSMTDGHFAPESFEQWARHFRRIVRLDIDFIRQLNANDSAQLHNVLSENDAPDYVKRCLGTYAERLAEAVF